MKTEEQAGMELLLLELFDKQGGNLLWWSVNPP